MTRAEVRPVALAGLLGTLAIAVLEWRFGSPMAVMGVLAALAGAALLLNPRFALLLLLVVVTVAEMEPRAGLADTTRLYRSAISFLAPIDLLLAAVTLSVALYAARPGIGVRLPGPFTLPLLAVTVAVIAGAVTGYYGGAPLKSLAGPIVKLAPLLLLPLLIATVARSPGDGRSLTRVGVALGAVRIPLGLLAFAFFGAFDPGLGGRSTSYEPASNWLVMVLLLGLAAAVLGRVRVRSVLLALLPLAFATLTLSYRRSFWIAAVVGLLLVLVVASGQVGRRLILPAIVVLALGIYVTFSAGAVGQLQGPVAARVQSLNPSKVGANEQDRYRIGERKNVVADIREHPLTGLGIGVDWHGRYPVTLSFADQRNYVHLGVLWFWLKFGLLGALAYLWIFATAVVTGVRIFRRHPDRTVGVAGLAVGVGALGLLVAELTASWVGPDQRMTLVFGAALGFLAVANREATAPRAAPAARAAPAEERVFA